MTSNMPLADWMWGRPPFANLRLVHHSSFLRAAVRLAQAERRCEKKSKLHGMWRECPKLVMKHRLKSIVLIEHDHDYP